MKNVHWGSLLLFCMPNMVWSQPAGVTNALAPPVDTVGQKIQPVRESIQRNTPLKEESLGTIGQDLKNSAPSMRDPLAGLPAQLPILDRSGHTAYVDVEVENGWRAVSREWLVSVNTDEIKAFNLLIGADTNIKLLDQTTFTHLGLTLVRLQVNTKLDSRSGLEQRLPDTFKMRLDRNHIYSAQIENRIAAPSPVMTVQSSPDISMSSKPVCNQPVNIGMLDTAIDSSHSAFVHQHIIAKDFLGSEFVAPEEHGTAVAGLLVGHGASLSPLLPQAVLYSASIFHARDQFAQAATMLNFVRGLDWLLSERVRIINMSLAGPDNKLLALAIASAQVKGAVLIAAAGNEGPASPPLFPAAYPGVITATAVDSAQHVYRWANQGPHIAFAALGVSVLTARANNSVGRETGTSMAAPVVTAFAACATQGKNLSSAQIKEQLAAQALDLGEPGRDPVFGYGLLQRPSEPGTQ